MPERLEVPSWSTLINVAKLPEGRSENIYPHVLLQEQSSGRLQFKVVAAPWGAVAPNTLDRTHVTPVAIPRIENNVADPCRVVAKKPPLGEPIVDALEAFWEDERVDAQYWHMYGAAGLSGLVVVQPGMHEYTLGDQGYAVTHQELVVASLRTAVSRELHPPIQSLNGVS